MTDVLKKKQQLLELLKIHYGFNSFWPGQEKVVDNILAGIDTVVIMPTGGGKSLCYQLPALVLDGVTLVVSPLIALMKDQVDGLLKIGIPATFINSSLSLAETANRLEAVKQGKYKLLYIAPERFYSAEFMALLNTIKVSLFAIDEAHCISQWGHDFRPSYLKLKNAIESLGRPTVIALTATATLEVREDIVKQLGIIDSGLVITGFARPNLQFGVINTNDSRKPQFVLDAISSLPAGKAGAPEGAGIIYVGTRSRADELLQVLLGNNIEAVSYHAGMLAEDRKWVQENFMAGKAKVIVATNAFGLGIDKRDIRFVIHYDMPGTIEAYYQEAGRAGRDGKQSFCLLLYSPRDRYLQEFFIKGDNPPPEIILEIYEILKNYPRDSAESKPLVDAFSASSADSDRTSSEQDRSGDSDTILITYASIAEQLSDKVPEMAVGTSLKILERLGLVARSYERSGQAFIKLTQNSLPTGPLRRSECEASRQANVKIQNLIQNVKLKNKNQQELLARLFEKYELQMREGLYVNLEEMAEILQVKKDTLARLIKKLAEADIIEYVPPFRGTELKILKRLDKNDVKLDFEALRYKLKHAYKKLDLMENYIYHFDCRQKYILNYFGETEAKPCAKCDNCLTENMGEVEKIQVKEKHKKKTSNLSTKLTQLETLELWNKGMSIEKIAEARELAAGTILGHLCFLLEKGLGIDIDRLVKPERQKKIMAAIKKVGPDKLTPIREALGEDYSWDEIKLTLAKMKTRNS